MFENITLGHRSCSVFLYFKHLEVLHHLVRNMYIFNIQAVRKRKEK
jgi:hypothetical protein